MSPRTLRRNFASGLLYGLRVVWPILSVLLALIGALGVVVGLSEGWSLQESIDFAFVSGLTIGYGDLAGAPRMKENVPTTAAVVPPAEWRVCGTPLKPVQGREIVTGEMKYGGDLTRPGMLHGPGPRRPGRPRAWAGRARRATVRQPISYFFTCVSGGTGSVVGVSTRMGTGRVCFGRCTAVL